MCSMGILGGSDVRPLVLRIGDLARCVLLRLVRQFLLRSQDTPVRKENDNPVFSEFVSNTCAPRKEREQVQRSAIIYMQSDLLARAELTKMFEFGPFSEFLGIRLLDEADAAFGRLPSGVHICHEVYDAVREICVIETQRHARFLDLWLHWGDRLTPRCRQTHEQCQGNPFHCVIGRPLLFSS